MILTRSIFRAMDDKVQNVERDKMFVRFMRFWTRVSDVSGVPLAGVSLLSADVVVAPVRPELISQRVFISRSSNKGPW
jgi:hypothetical protein